MLNTVSSCLIQMLTQTSRRFVSSSTAQAGLRSPQLSKWIYNWFFEMVCTRGVSVPLCQGALWFLNLSCPFLPGFAFKYAGRMTRCLTCWGVVGCCCHDLSTAGGTNLAQYWHLPRTSPFSATFYPPFHPQTYGLQSAGNSDFVYLCF